MKYKIYSPLFLLALFTFCKPDLRVVSVSCDSTTKTIKAVIKNAGNLRSGGFRVDFRAIEQPPSPPRYAPRFNTSRPWLKQGTSVTETATFNSRPQNNYLRNIRKVQVTVDPKNTIKESNEENNTKTVPCTFR